MIKVGVVGAGPIGCATAAYLCAHGHQVHVWSPRAASPHCHDGKVQVTCTGGLSDSFAFDLLERPDALADLDLVVICLPGHAYADVLGLLNRHWRSGQTVIVSGSLSLCPLWLKESAQARGQQIQAVGWGTTVTTAHFLDDGRLHVNPLRERIDMAAIGTPQEATALTLCQTMLGDRFVCADSLLVPTLANINPIAHAAEVIPNLTRMDLGETWSLFGCFTSVVARLAEDLDQERLAVARAFGFELPSLQAHYSRSYHVAPASLQDIAAEVQKRGMGPNGPRRLDHRYVLEDVPFGMVCLQALARMVAVKTPVLSSSITLLGSAYGRDFRGDNFLLGALSLDSTDAASLRRRCAAAHSAARLPS